MVEFRREGVWHGVTAGIAFNAFDQHFAAALQWLCETPERYYYPAQYDGAIRISFYEP